MFDKGYPVPVRKSRWNFADAEVGDSLWFATLAGARSFAEAVRKCGRGFGSTKAEQDDGWRVWIVDSAIRAKKAPVVSVSSQSEAHPSPALPTVPAQPYPLSTLTDDDLSIVVDLRRGDDFHFVRAPEANQVDPGEAVRSGRKPRGHTLV